VLCVLLLEECACACLLITANAVITNDLDYMYIVVLRGSNRTVTSRAATLSQKKKRSGPLFIFGGAAALCRILFKTAVTLPNSHSAAICGRKSLSFFLADATRGNNCAERTLIDLACSISANQTSLPATV
jgi:hypothetical protein